MIKCSLSKMLLTVLIIISLFFTLYENARAGWKLIDCATETVFWKVWGSSPNDVFLIGREGGSLYHDGFPVVFHYDGTKCTLKYRGTEDEWFHDIWGTSPTNVFVAGQKDYQDQNKSIVYHYNGMDWSIQILEEGGLRGIQGSSTDDIYAVGFDSIYHFDGKSWSPMVCDILNQENSPQLYGVWASSSTDVFAVGKYNNPILHYDGISCSIMDDVEYSLLNAVWGSSSTDVFAVSDYGDIWHYDGKSWTFMESETNKDLFDVWGSSPNDVYAVGFNVILHYDGTEWSPVDTGLESYLNAGEGVWGSSANDVFIASHAGGMLHYDGNPVTTTIQVTTTVPTTTTTPVTTTNPVTTSIYNSTTTTTCVCPILCAYDGDSEEVELLRYIRDNVLTQSPEGQEIIRLYYEWSPAIVQAMEEDEEFKGEVKEIIDGVLPLIEDAVD